MIIIIIILSILVVLLGYLTFINYQRAERATDYCTVYVKFVAALYYKFTDTKDRMEQIDRLGAFKADDEVGTIFNDINESIHLLHEFIAKYIDNDKEGKKTED